MNISVLFQGYPGRFEQGYLAWPTVVYVQHAGVKILVDTGFSTQKSHLPDILREHGTTPADIDIVVLTHLHFDHVSNFDIFPKARFMVHQAEVEHVCHGHIDWAYHRYHYDLIKGTGRMEIVTADTEIAPDIYTLHVAGHTPGCMALVLRAAGQPVTVVAGDAVKNISELATCTVPMVTDPAAASASIRTIRAMADIVIPGHDRVLRVYPDHIEAVTSHTLDLLRLASNLPQGIPEKLSLGFGPSSLPRCEESI